MSDVISSVLTCKPIHLFSVLPELFWMYFSFYNYRKCSATMIPSFILTLYVPKKTLCYIFFFCITMLKERFVWVFSHTLLSWSCSSQPIFFLSCTDFIIFITDFLWLCVFWPTRSFHTLRKCIYPLQLHYLSSLDLDFTPGILITHKLIGHTSWSHLWTYFLNFEELTVGVTVFLRLGLVEP